MTTQFDDGKDDGALRTIGEVSRALGIKTHVLRYWEQQFPMLEPLKRSGGRRYYRTEDVELIETINRLVNEEGYTLKGAEQAISSGKATESANDELDVPTDTQSLIDDHVKPASDGGVDTFFSKETESDPVPEDAGSADESTPEQEKPEAAASDVTSDAAEAEASRAEVLAKLKDIRSRLAEAIAA